MKTAQKIEPQEKTSLSVSKFINAPVAKVYGAWTKPELMNQWFAPDLKKITPIAQADFRVGGSWSIHMKQETGGPKVGGKYLEIVAHKKIAFTWVWEGMDGCAASGPVQEPVKVDSVVTVEFKDKNGGTEVTLTHTRLPNTEQVDRHTEGWNGCLASLAAFAEK